jgi:hypothetical protein
MKPIELDYKRLLVADQDFPRGALTNWSPLFVVNSGYVLTRHFL